MTHIVTAPYVTIKVPTISGMTLVGFYRDAPVPAGADRDDLERLTRKGMLTEVAGPTPEPEPETEPTAGDRPKDYAPKGDWVDYAVSKRADDVSEEDARATAEGKTKDALIVEHG